MIVLGGRDKDIRDSFHFWYAGGRSRYFGGHRVQIVEVHEFAAHHVDFDIFSSSAHPIGLINRALVGCLKVVPVPLRDK